MHSPTPLLPRSRTTPQSPPPSPTPHCYHTSEFYFNHAPSAILPTALALTTISCPRPRHQRSPRHREFHIPGRSVTARSAAIARPRALPPTLHHRRTPIPYDSLFPHGEAQKAAQRVLEEIEEQQKQLDHLRAFASENVDLINLVRRLPDDLHHQIMVLLGEGYYAERTAKQTVGVLMRRGQALKSNTEALHAAIADLKARADFFGAIAGDSVEGIVEIREFEEPQKGDAGVSDSGSLVSTSKRTEKEIIIDEEYERILAGLDDLEKAECAAESISSDHEVKSAKSKISDHTDDHHKNIVYRSQKLQPSDTDYLTEVRGTKVTNQECGSKARVFYTES